MSLREITGKVSFPYVLLVLYISPDLLHHFTNHNIMSH